jgi:hypothetical protein
MMMTVKVYQFHLTEADEALLNKDGWLASEKITAYADKGCSWKVEDGSYDAEKWFHAYSHVATVDADDLDEVFHLTNLWHKPELVEKHSRMHSVSIGDILEMNGEFFLVAGCGFETLNISEAA